MKKQLYAFVFVVAAIAAGCSTKAEPEPEPAEQVIGTYTVKTWSASYLGSIISGYDYPITEQDTTSTGLIEKYEITEELGVLKKASNQVSIVSTVFAKNLRTSKVDSENEALFDVELKKNTSNSFDMIDTSGSKIGEINKDNITIDYVRKVTLPSGNYDIRIKYSGVRKI